MFFSAIGLNSGHRLIGHHPRSATNWSRPQPRAVEKKAPGLKNSAQETKKEKHDARLAQFHREYKARRLKAKARGAQFMNFGEAERRLRKLIADRLQAAAPFRKASPRYLIGKVLCPSSGQKSVCLYVSHWTSMMRSFGLPVDVTPLRPNSSNDCSRSLLRTA